MSVSYTHLVVYKRQLEVSLTNLLNRGIDAVHGYQARLYEPVTLGERTYVPMEVGEKLGYALLERSITGRYRIAHTSSGNAPFRCGVIEENGGKQLLFQGRNTFCLLYPSRCV